MKRHRPTVVNPSQLTMWDAPPPEPGAPTVLPMPEAEVTFYPAFLSPGEAQDLFEALLATAPWKQERREMYGREVDVPRLQAWYADERRYDVADTTIASAPWTPRIAALRERVAGAIGARFNAVLINRYRTGQDSVAWHSDYEAMFGARPVIPLLSLGATRRFMFRPKPGSEGEPMALDLPAGSLLVMAGGTQQHWEHCIAKTARPVGERMSLTFRRMVTD